MTPLQILLINLTLLLYLTLMAASISKNKDLEGTATATVISFLNGLAFISLPFTIIWCILTYVSI